MRKFYFVLAAIVLAAIIMTGCAGQSAEPTEKPTQRVIVVTATKDVQELIEASVASTLAAKESESDSDADSEPKAAAVSLAEPADLGPWAPGEGWTGENFEATCNQQVCQATHLQLWWPQGDTPWDVDEVHTILPPGLSITVIHGAGRGWEYPQGYALEDIQERILADLERRSDDTSLFGFVSVDELIELGLVEVRFDRRNGDFGLEIESVYP